MKTEIYERWLEAKGRIDELEASIAETAASLDRSVKAIMRDQAVAGKFDNEAFRAFLKKPYLVRPVKPGHYELIVPTFVGFSAGWPVRHTDQYSVFHVTRFTNMMNPLPKWLADELGFRESEFKAALDGDTLHVLSGDAAKFHAKLGDKMIERRVGNKLVVRPSLRFDLLRKIIREEGFLPYTPTPIPDKHRRDAGQFVARHDGKPAFELREHQAKDFREFETLGAAVILAYFQTGKSFVALHACAALAGPKIIFAPSRALVAQWRARLDYYLAPAAAAEVTLSTYHGAGKHLSKEWSLVVFDECFPEGTLVDGIPIENLSVGDSVTAWDEKRNLFARSFVTQVFKRLAPKKLLRISCGEWTVTCTESHPILTGRGWQLAKNIIHGDTIYHAEIDDVSVRLVRNDFRDNRQNQNRLFQGDEKSLLLKGTLRIGEGSRVISDDGGDEQTVCLRKNENKESNGKCVEPEKGKHAIARNELASKAAGRERSPGAVLAAVAGGCVEMADGTCGKNRLSETARWNSDALQNRHSKPGIEDWDRSGRQFAQTDNKDAIRQEKAGLPLPTRVDRIEILEQGRGDEFGEVCRDGYVYNIEVERYSTYLANGFIVHNCHHIPADFAIEASAKIRTVSRIGLSGTPFREDGQEDLIPALCGFPLGADWPVSDLQRPTIHVWVVPGERAKYAMVSRFLQERTSGKTLVFVRLLDVGERIAKQNKIPFVSGRTKNAIQVIDEHDVVVISSVGNEGLSIPVNRVIEVDFHFGSRMEFGQRLGRLGYVEGKTKSGIYHLLMTPVEFERYGKRLLVAEQFGLEVIMHDEERKRSAAAPRPRAPRSPSPSSRHQMPGVKSNGGADEIARLMSLPPVNAKIMMAEKSVGRTTQPFIRRVFRKLYGAAYTKRELAEALGLTNPSTIAGYGSAVNALDGCGVLERRGERYTIDHGEVARLQALHQSLK